MLNNESRKIYEFTYPEGVEGTYYLRLKAQLVNTSLKKEDEDYKKSICSTALVFTLGTSLVVFGLMILLRDYIAEFFLKDRGLANLIYIVAIATLVGGTNSIVSAPTRMQNKRKVFLISFRCSCRCIACNTGSRYIFRPFSWRL